MKLPRPKIIKIVVTQLGEKDPYTGLYGPGGTATLLEFYLLYEDGVVKVRRILIDAGAGITDVSYEGGRLYFPAFEYLVNAGIGVDLIINTHIHADHVLGLPLASRYFPDAPVLMNEGNYAATSDIIIPDSLKIWDQDKRRAIREKREAEPAPYYEADVNRFLSNVRMVEYGWIKHEDWPLWRFGFETCGHEPNAMSILIVTPDGKCFYYTGDISSHPQPLTDGDLLPPTDTGKGSFSAFLRLARKRGGLTLITEATNGSRNVRPHAEQAEDMMKDLESVVADDGISLSSVFALGRSVNIAFHITRRSKYSVHMVGMACKAYLHYMKYHPQEHIREELRKLLLDKRVILVGYDNKGNKIRDDSEIKRHCEQLAIGACGCASHAPIILAPSANMDKGWAAYFAKIILRGKRNAVFSTGHIFEKTPMEQMRDMSQQDLEHGKTVFIDGEPVPVACRVFLYSFTAHDGGDALVRRVGMTGATNVVAHHADDHNMWVFGENVSRLPNPPKFYEARHLRPVEINF